MSGGEAAELERAAADVGGDVRGLGLDLGEERVARARAAQVRLVAGDRVARAPELHLVVGAVLGGVVARGVRAHAVGQRLDEARALAGAGLVEGDAGHGVAREHVVAVDLHAGMPKPVAAQVQRRARLARDRHRDRPVVVLQEEDLRASGSSRRRRSASLTSPWLDAPSPK